MTLQFIHVEQQDTKEPSPPRNLGNVKRLLQIGDSNCAFFFVTLFDQIVFSINILYFLTPYPPPLCP